MSNPTHPKCGKSYPGGSTAGHCSGCCETFIGLTAFEQHRRGEHGVDRRCEITDKHWTDERGYYHHGPKLTDEQKAKMWPTADTRSLGLEGGAVGAGGAGVAHEGADGTRGAQKGAQEGGA